MSGKADRERWIEEVFHTPRVSAEVKVFLLFLERYYMRPDGEVREPRNDLAKVFGCHPRKITAKFNMAIVGGLMEQTVRGGKGRTATYRATLPGRPGDRSGCQHPAPYARAKGAADYHPKQPAQGASNRHPEASQGASTRHPERDRLYKDRAHADPKRTDDTSHGDPAPSGTDTPPPNETKTRVSQSARKREAHRWLAERYGLTEFESASVVAEVTARAPREIRSPVRYMDAMKEGDLADIVAAVQCRTDNDPFAEPVEKDARPLAAVPEWCGSCDERTRLVDLDDGRVARCTTCNPRRARETA